MKKIATLLFITISLNSISQYSTSEIDINNVSALITDGGVIFNNQVNSSPGYEVPKNSGINALYSAAFWFAGQDVAGQWCMSATHFGASQDIFPGPVANPGEYASSAYLNDYLTAIWTVTQSEIDLHISNWNQVGYSVPLAIENWPGNGNTTIGVAEQLAPYVDINGNNIYEPSLGDYPNIRGDKATYVIMNDMAQVHTATVSEKIGIEVHLMLYQYTTSNYLNDITFVNTRVFNRGTKTFLDFKTSFFADGDLGNPTDDYFGCDSLENMIYTYNSDNFDEDGSGLGYGTNPPAIGIVSLNNPMTGACYYSNSGSNPMNDPSNATEHWNFMTNSWGDGSSWVVGGSGFPGSAGATSTPTNYLFSGNPSNNTEWSETAMSNLPGDRRMLMNLPAISFQPGDQYCYDFAVVYGRGTDNLASVQELKLNASSVQNFYDNQSYSCEQVVLGLNEIENNLLKIYPNPTNGTFTISSEENLLGAQIIITNLSGRIVYKEDNLSSNSFNISLNEPTGIYFVNIVTPNGVFTKKIALNK